jgi:hypothetical protein
METVGNLRGVELVISDAHKGIKSAVAKVLNATWQHCRVCRVNTVQRRSLTPRGTDVICLECTKCDRRAAGLL